jgi:predicted site-specific integrase-resolvase
MSRFLKIGKAAALLGVTPQTLRRWEREGVLLPDRKGLGDTRYYDEERLRGINREKESDLTICYARVSSHDQKELLSLYCSQHGWTFEVIQDLGSGMNYHKKGLKRLIDFILERKIRRLVITHKDRLLRFGAELILTLCEICSVEVVILNQGEELSFEQELAQDVLEIITVFSARLYGSRSKKNKKLIEAAKVLVSDG